MIPGTQVPDNAIHRASLWLEDVKYDLRREPQELGEMKDSALADFIEQTGLPVSVVELLQAAMYYGTNMTAIALTEAKVKRPEDDGEAAAMVSELQTAFVSCWLDGFMHGMGTAKGKRGYSNAEMS